MTQCVFWAWRQSDKKRDAVIVLTLGLMVHVFKQSFLEGIREFHLFCIQDQWQIERLKKERAQILLSLVSLHSWPITAWSGWEVQVVVTESKRKCWNNTSESTSAQANCQLYRWFCPTDVVSQTSAFHTPRSKSLDACHTPAIYKSLRRFSYFSDQNALSGWSPL